MSSRSVKAGVFELLTALRGRCHLIGACDPSLRRKGQRSDFTAILSLAQDLRTGILYVLDSDISKKRPDETIEAILQLCRYRRYAAFGFETNQFQEFVAAELRRRSAAQKVHLPVYEVKHTDDKIGRIQLLQPIVRHGLVRFSRRHHQLPEQLQHFPKAAHDDGPDALELALRVARGAWPPMQERIWEPPIPGTLWLPADTRIVGNFLEGWMEEQVF